MASHQMSAVQAPQSPTTVSWKEEEAVAYNVNIVHKIFADCKGLIQRYKDLSEPMLIHQVDVDPEMTAMMLADGNWQLSMLDRWLQRDAIYELDWHLGQPYAEKAYRPRFDFYANKIQERVAEAVAKHNTLRQVVSTLEHHASAAKLFLPFGWEEEAEVEPDFGTVELDLLKRNQQGKKLLEKPITEGNIAAAEAKVERVSHEWVMKMHFERHDDIDTWFQGQMQDFIASKQSSSSKHGTQSTGKGVIKRAGKSRRDRRH